MSRDSANGLVFFFNDTATTEIYTLSLHDALPISQGGAFPIILDEADVVQHRVDADGAVALDQQGLRIGRARLQDRKSTRLNSSHANISYAVFCLKKKKTDIR